MRKGVFKRIKALVSGRFICRIYDGEGIVHESFNLMEASTVLARMRKANPSYDYQLKLEEM